MAKQALPGKRANMFLMDPNEVIIIGHDTDDGPEHPLYDERIKLPVDDAMTANIRAIGVIEPVTVTKVGDTAIVVDGRRRVIHARLAREQQAASGEVELLVPVQVKRGDDSHLFGVSRSANNFRVDDDPLLNAKNAARLLDMGKDEDEIALYFGVTKQTVKNWLSLLECSARVKKAVSRGEVSPTAASKLAKLPREEQDATLDELVAEGAKPTVARAARKAGKKNGSSRRSAPPKKALKALAAAWDGREESAEKIEEWVDEAFVDGVKFAIGLMAADDYNAQLAEFMEENE